MPALSLSDVRCAWMKDASVNGLAADVLTPGTPAWNPC